MALTDFFLKIEGIDGESTDHKMKGSIDIESFSWGVTQSGTHAFGGGGGAGKANFQDFHFVMKVNKASPKLMLACATGEHLKAAKLTVRKAGGDQHEYLTVTMTDCLVSSYQTGGSEGSSILPLDQISLNFAKVETEFKPQKDDGTLGSPVKTGYSIKENKKI
jgi:type VI secretion system secreted protein Hcp